MRTNELILYKNMEYEELLLDMTFLMEHYDNEYYNQEDLKGLLFSCMNELLELSESVVPGRPASVFSIGRNVSPTI
jgi:uncharacterized protein